MKQGEDQHPTAFEKPAANTIVTPAPSTSDSSLTTPRSPTPGDSGGPAGEDAGKDDRHARREPFQLEPGARIGPYELIRELGRGGMGTVHLARDTKLGRRVAIKCLRSEEPRFTKRFVLEARTTAQCSHENIVVIHDVGEHEGHPFMVLEFLNGAPLSAQLKRGRRLPASQAVTLVVPVVRALECAHERQIVHRDLKPDNIFITDSGTVKVLDFGIAKLLQEHLPRSDAAASGDGASAGDELANPHLTRSGALIGTLPYMSPEQWGAGDIDHRTDIWAVGIILFRMVTGRHPLSGLRGRQLAVIADLDRPMPGVRDARPDVPDELADIIDRCLIKDKRHRMASARALLDALEPLLPGQLGRQLRADESPYAGLRPFQEADANRFFGRSREVAAAVVRLRDQPLVGVVGPSGMGKSSFVRAGLVPALKRSGEAWGVFTVRPGRSPMAALAHVIAPIVRNTSTTAAGDAADHQITLERLYDEPGFLGTVLRSRARRKGQNILLFVDQFEELYTQGAGPRERLAFTACLASMADDTTTPLRVILSIRSDFLDRVPEDERFMADLTRGLFFLMPPNRDGLRDAIVQPAEMAGCQFESEAVVEHMLDHLEHTPGALPLLQFAAAKLWELRDTSSKLLTEDSYAAIGGIAGALASHADTVVDELPARSRGLARTLFVRLVTPERTRAVVPMDELDELSRDPRDVKRLIDHLVNARLLVVQTGGAARAASVEIVHESLIHSWPLLQRWLDESQEDAVFVEQLRTASKQWQSKGYSSGLLWRGETVDEAQRFCRRYRGELTELQRSYLSAVFALAARAARRKRIAVVSTIGVLSLLVAAAAVALVLIRNAQQQATDQAEAARIAEGRVRAQLTQVREAQRVQARAEETMREASATVAQTNEQLRDKNAELERALTRAEQSRAQAEASERRAETARQQAVASALVARDAEAKALAETAKANRLSAELQAKLEAEKRRNQALREKLREYITDIDVRTGKPVGAE